MEKVFKPQDQTASLMWVCTVCLDTPVSIFTAIIMAATADYQTEKLQ